MSVSVERFVDDPIVVFNFGNHLDSTTVDEFNRIIGELLLALGTF